MSRGIIQSNHKGIMEITLQLLLWDLFLIISSLKTSLKIRQCLSTITNRTMIQKRIPYLDKVCWVQQQITELRLLKGQVLRYRAQILATWGTKNLRWAATTPRLLQICLHKLFRFLKRGRQIWMRLQKPELLKIGWWTTKSPLLHDQCQVLMNRILN